jgi:hypothetical protein
MKKYSKAILMATIIGSAYLLAEFAPVTDADARTRVNYRSGGWDIEFGSVQRSSDGQDSRGTTGKSNSQGTGSASATNGSAPGGAPAGGAGNAGNAGNAGGVGNSASGGLIVQFLKKVMGW